MHINVKTCMFTTCVFFLPHQLCYEIFISEYFIHHLPEVIYFIIINTHKNDAVLAQQLSRQQQAWIHHVQPVGVKAPAGFGIGCQWLSCFIHLPGASQVGL